MISVRGVQLAAMLMHGVEHAVFVNDVAGSPLPLSLFCPWMFFDGKLFQYKLLKATTTAASLRQLCDDSVRLVSLDLLFTVCGCHACVQIFTAKFEILLPQSSASCKNVYYRNLLQPLLFTVITSVSETLGHLYVDSNCGKGRPVFIIFSRLCSEMKCS